MLRRIANQKGDRMIGQNFSIFSRAIAMRSFCYWAGIFFASTAPGQIFVAQWNTGLYDGTIGAYTLTGSRINSAVVSGLVQPEGLATDGRGNLFVANFSY